MKNLNILVAVTLMLASASVHGQSCAGGELKTQQAYKYGRFETRMQSAQGDGIVSSFFAYNTDLGCNWPAENNEIDVEMTGNQDASVQFTTHYPGPWSATQIIPTPFNPHADMHDYAFEWEPGIVRWFVDGNLVYTQDAPFVDGLIYPMRILMNLYAADAPTWVGIWDPAVLPVSSSYENVRYYAYTPGSGNAGTNNSFTLEWTDEFDAPLDTDRWEVTEFGGFGGNYCTFVANNVTTAGGKLQLGMTEPLTTTGSPVHFSVDVTSLQLSPSDVVYLNGGFNNWCGSCNAMADADGDNIWELTLWLPAGNHEYLFTVNGWDGEIGGAPQGSSCDFKPCDQYTNYGIAVPYGAGGVDTDTYCWASCDACPVDVDDDGVPDSLDNCPTVANPLQKNNDGDVQGDICDDDDDNDGLTDLEEVNFDGNAAYNPLTDTDPFNSDTDSDGIGDLDEINYDGDTAYNPATDTNPLSNNTDADAYLDGVDPIPLNFNFDDGDVAPWGAPDSMLNVGDLLICAQFIVKLKEPTNDDLAHGDLYPVGAPDGVIGLSDYVQLMKRVLE
jgi:beta-glucanase (GH16 family)